MERLCCHVNDAFDELSQLLFSSEFSDLTLVCQGQKFPVHKAIVCPRSRVFTAAVKGNFKEAKTGEIAVEIGDAATLRLALTYLYAGTYDDSNLFETVCMAPPLPCIVAEHKSTDLNEPDPELSNTAEGAQQFRNAPDQSENSGADVSSTEVKSHATACEYRLLEEDQLFCTNAILRTNILVCIFADYYQIDGLVRLAKIKFKQALNYDDVCLQDFGEVCLLVWESIPQEHWEFKLMMLDAIKFNSQKLCNDSSFMKTAFLSPELLRDAFTSVSAMLAWTAKDKKDAMSENVSLKKLHLEQTRRQLEKAKSDVTHEREAIYAKVNNADKCGHCRATCNVSLEYDQSDPSNPHILRCVCRLDY